MKFVKFLLCAAILLGSANGVYAAEDGGVAEALRQVKERVDTSGYSEFKSSYYKDEDGNPSYYFNWSNDEESYSGLYIDFSDGIITSYGKYDYDGDYSTDAFSLNEEEAAQISKEFIKRINPQIYQNIGIIPQKDMSIYSDDYTLNLYHKENGIPVLGDTGYISVSKKTKEVSSFYINYTSGIKFKAVDNIISELDAKEAYKNLIPPTLRYKFKTDYSKKEITAYLEYASCDSSLAINAYDGQTYKISSGYDAYYSKNTARSEDAAEGGFTPAEFEETERIAGLLSETKVTDIAKSNEIIAMPKGFQREYISLNRDWYNKNEYIYNLEFTNDDRYIGVRIDAKSGEILSFNNYNWEDKKDKKDLKTEAKKAEKAFFALAGDKASEFRMEDADYAGMVEFVRTVGDIDVIGNSAYFDFDDEDNIVAYNLSYTKDVDFPSAEGVISAFDAAEAAFQAVGFELGYDIDLENKTAQPVYYIGKDGETEGFMLNPFSGKLIGYDGDDLEDIQKITYSDIDGHYGKDIFLALAEYGIGFDGGELKPDEAITQAEYFVLLNKAFGYEADTDEIYKRMIRGGSLSAEERADSGILTRENAAIFMIREMGAERYAKHNDIFAAPFTDVTENKGYIAILKAEKVINGDGSGMFYPQNPVTRGEALIMLYNYFSK